MFLGGRERVLSQRSSPRRPSMTPDPDTLAKQREQLAKRRALRASIPEEAALEAAAGASPANSSRGSSEGAAIAEAAAAMAAGDPTHPATLFASFQARDAGERRAAASSRAAAAAQLAEAGNARKADEDALRPLAVAVVDDPVRAPVSDVAAQTDPPPPAPPRVVRAHDPPTVDAFAAVVLALLVVGVVACACVFPAQGERDARGDARRWEKTLAAWSVANDLPRVASLEGFYAAAAKGATRGIEAYLPPTRELEDSETDG